MKVISRIKARHSHVRNVTVNGTPYAFQRGDDGEFACEVNDPTDLRVFVASRHFQVAGTPVLANPQAAMPPASDENKSAENTDDGHNPLQVNSLIDAEAQTLLEGSASEVGRNIGSVSSLDVIRCAIELEQAPDGKQRKGVDTMLRQALAAAEQAGVTL